MSSFCYVMRQANIRTVGSDLSDIYLSRNLIYPMEDWGTKSAAYYCIDTSYPTSDLSDKFEGTDDVG